MARSAPAAAVFVRSSPSVLLGVRGGSRLAMPTRLNSQEQKHETHEGHEKGVRLGDFRGAFSDRDLGNRFVFGERILCQ